MQFLKSLMCKLRKHIYKEVSIFTGGIEYKCIRCGKKHISFCYCPSYSPTNDMELFESLNK